MDVKCTTAECGWRLVSASNLALTTFVYDHAPKTGHRYARVADANGWRLYDTDADPAVAKAA